MTLRHAYLGSLVADALAMPGHWYCDREALRRDYGMLDHYQAPRNPHPGSILWRSEYHASSRKAWRWATRPDDEIIGIVLSPACYIAEAFPAALYLARKYHDNRRQKTKRASRGALASTLIETPLHAIHSRAAKLGR